MLLPALSRAKIKAKTATDLNNMRQIGLGVQMYANDFDDYLVYCNWGKVSLGFTYMAGWLYTPNPSGVPPQLTQSPYNTTPQMAYETGLLFPSPNPWTFIGALSRTRAPTVFITRAS